MTLLSILQWLVKIWFLISYKFRKSQIYINRVTLSGNDSFIDVRYWLSRPDKISGSITVYLIDEATGARFELLRLSKYGLIRTKQFAGILLFRNRKKQIKPGSKVTIPFGQLWVQHLEVK